MSERRGDYRNKWKSCIEMLRIRISRTVIEYVLRGRRRLECLEKEMEDQKEHNRHGLIFDRKRRRNNI